MRGFTLIELLIGIAIIGILSYMIFAVVQPCDEECRKKRPIKESELSDKDFCEKKARYLSVNELPATCLKFYQR